LRVCWGNESRQDQAERKQLQKGVAGIDFHGWLSL
jgi:hypothetical protein